jgi:hypothetical protein
VTQRETLLEVNSEANLNQDEQDPETELSSNSLSTKRKERSHVSYPKGKKTKRIREFNVSKIFRQVVFEHKDTGKLVGYVLVKWEDPEAELTWEPLEIQKKTMAYQNFEKKFKKVSSICQYFSFILMQDRRNFQGY